MMQSVEDEDGARARGHFDGSSNPAFVPDEVAAESSEATASNGDLPNLKPKVNPFSIQE